jgi:hypothetical protein
MEIGSKRTTPSPRVDVADLLPEMASRARTTIRLHPRRLGEDETLPRTASKMGGDFLWPADEPWMFCPSHKLPYVGVLQLHRADFPEVQFKPGTDLLQVFWCPQLGHGRCPDPDPVPVLVWRDMAGATGILEDIPYPRLLTDDERHDLVLREYGRRWVTSLAKFPGLMRRQLQYEGTLPPFSAASGLPRWFLDMPVQTDEQFEEVWKAAQRVVHELEERSTSPDHADDNLFPLACRLFPERVREYPRELSNEEKGRLLDALANVLRSTGEELERGRLFDIYRWELSVANGTKLGGYMSWVQRPEEPRCDCGHVMDHLLTIASAEWHGGDWMRWRAAEEQALYEHLWSAGDPDAESLHRPAGLMLGDVGKIYIFICRRCETWPSKSVFQCS